LFAIATPYSVENRTMKKKFKTENNFVDALEGENKYAVLTKTRRIQILVEPSAKQLRKRGKRAWELYGTVDNSADAGRTLIETIQRAILEMETASAAAVSDDG
jgi:hypothetical protein